MSLSRSKQPRWQVALLLGCLVAVDARAFEPAVNYMIQCMGCHTPDGRGEPGHVPSVRDTLRPLANSVAGRKFLVQVPGSAQSKLSDAELADVLNWMIDNLSATPGPRAVMKFTGAEVASYRGTRLVAVGATRARLVAGIPGLGGQPDRAVQARPAPQGQPALRARSALQGQSALQAQ